MSGSPESRVENSTPIADGLHVDELQVSVGQDLGVLNLATQSSLGGGAGVIVSAEMPHESKVVLVATDSSGISFESQELAHPELLTVDGGAGGVVFVSSGVAELGSDNGVSFPVEPLVEKRKKLFKKLFSKKARRGEDRVDEEGQVRHIPGWYEKYPELSHQQIDEILRYHGKRAKKAKLITYFGAIIEGDLERARTHGKTEAKKKK